MMMRHGTRGGIVLEILVLVIAAGLVYKAVAAGFTTYKFVHMAEIVDIDGTIKGVEDHGFTVAIQFALVNGEKIDFTQHVIVPKYVNDQRVPVAYDSNQPTTARLNTFSALWFHTIVFGIPGLLLLILGLRLHTERSL